jgi:hypothetical protein
VPAVITGPEELVDSGGELDPSRRAKFIENMTQWSDSAVVPGELEKYGWQGRSSASAAGALDLAHQAGVMSGND